MHTVIASLVNNFFLNNRYTCYEGDTKSVFAQIKIQIAGKTLEYILFCIKPNTQLLRTECAGLFSQWMHQS